MSRIPSRDEILDWISAHPTQTSKRDIAKAFGIKGADRIELKRVLRGLEEDGHLEKRRKTYRDPDRLPPVSVLEITGLNDEGEPVARAMEWHGEGPSPVVLMLTRATDPALGQGDRILARVAAVREETHAYEGRLIRRIGQTARKVLGVFRASSEGGRITPIDKGSDREWRVGERDTGGAKDGELVEAEQAGPRTAWACRAPASSPGSATLRRPGPCPSSRSITTGSPTTFPKTSWPRPKPWRPRTWVTGSISGTNPLSPLTPPMPATMTTPAGPMPMTTPRTPAAM